MKTAQMTILHKLNNEIKYTFQETMNKNATKISKCYNLKTEVYTNLFYNNFGKNICFLL